MSRKVSFLEAIGFNGDTMSSLLPRYNSPPRRSSYDHDLEELEPRPDDALLYTDYDSPKMPSRTHSTDSSMLSGSPHTPASASSKGKGKAVAIAYQGRPGSWRQPIRKSSFVPPIPPDITARRAPQYYPESVSEPAPEASFIDTLLPRRTRPDELPTNLRVQVDDTFKEIARRERQMQKELQRLLDAQAAAVDQKLFGGQEKDTKSVTGTPNTSRSQSASYTSTSSRREKSSRHHVIPVRQPAERRLTLGQTRSRIIGVMRMLADLKAEEDAYIATALAQRKAELSKLGTLKTRHQQIKHDIQEIEKDPSDPLTNDIRTIEGELQTVSGQIEEYKRLLRRAEQNKVTLERRLEEAKSEAESRLSGYKGALRECETGIRELVRRPNIRVLELAPSQPPTAEQAEEDNNGNDTGNGGDQQQQQQQHYITGFEFFRLRPERRTLPMARDWWEGEVAALERRRTAVERERAALEEGEAIWAEVIDTIQRHEEQLTGALSGEGQPNNTNNSGHYNRSGSSSPLAQRDGSLGPVSSSSPIPSRASTSADPRDVMRGQWDLLVAAIRKLERAHAYAEERGWTLLVAAIGAEISVYYDAREMLGDMLRSMGISPPPPPLEERSPGPEAAQQQSSSPLGANLVDTDVAEEGQRVGSGGRGAGDALMHEELSGSVIRRWENPDLDLRDMSNHDSQQPEGQQPQQKQWLEKADSCADPFQPILPAKPPSPPELTGQAGFELTSSVRHAVGETTDSEEDNNEVPAGLLNEEAAHHSEDEQQQQQQEKRHSNEVPLEFLSLHAGHNHAFPPAAAAARGGDEDLKESSGSGPGHRYRQSDMSTADGSLNGNDNDHENANQVPLDLLSERRGPGLEDGGVD